VRAKDTKIQKGFFGGLLIERNPELVPDAGTLSRFSDVFLEPRQVRYEDCARPPRRIRGAPCGKTSWLCGTPRSPMRGYCEMILTARVANTRLGLRSSGSGFDE
jgi:hypothetical protein